jgi:hypothetical protein
MYYYCILYLFTCLLSSPKANYKISTSEDGNKQRHTHKHRQKAKQGNVYHLENYKNSMRTSTRHYAEKNISDAIVLTDSLLFSEYKFMVMTAMMITTRITMKIKMLMTAM